MSQALQSLNAILKYKQERERQKIDKSLAMLDMGRRLQQQEREAAFQAQTMALRDAQERRATAAEKASIQEQEQNLQLKNLQIKKTRTELNELNKAVASGEVDRKRELSIQILEEDLKQEKIQTEVAISQRAEQAFDATKLVVERDYFNQTENILDNFQQQNIIPSVVFSKIETSLANQDFEIDQVRDSILEAVEGVEKKYLTKLIGKNSKYGDALLVGIYNSAFNQVKDTGIKNNEFVMDAIDNISGSIANDIELLQLATDLGIDNDELRKNLLAVQQIQNQKQIYNNRIVTGEIQDAVDRVSRNNFNKEINELAREIAQRKGLNFKSNTPPSDDERDELIKQGFPIEEIDS